MNHDGWARQSFRDYDLFRHMSGATFALGKPYTWERLAEQKALSIQRVKRYRAVKAMQERAREK